MRKLLKMVYIVLILISSSFVSLYAIADNNILTVMDNPITAKQLLDGKFNASYMVQSSNGKHSSMTIDSKLIRYSNTTSWSLWGNANNTYYNNKRSSEKYEIGGRIRYNITDLDYLFGQMSWLIDRYNTYRQRDVLIAGYGRQFINGSVHSFRFEFGPGIRYDNRINDYTKIHLLGYASSTYAWQFTDDVKFSQGVSVLSANDNSFNSETALNVAINEHLGFKVAYNIRWNSELSFSTLQHIDRKTIVSMDYKT